MSTATAEPKLASELFAAIRSLSPRQQMAVLNELVRIHHERTNGSEAPTFVWNEDGLVTAILLPCAKPWDPNAHMKDPDREEIIRREMEEVIRREGPPIKLL